MHPKPTDMTPAIERYIQNLSQVDGWGINDDVAPIFVALNEAQDSLSVRGNLFEIGVHEGRTAILLALMAKAEESCVFLDLFDQQEQNLDQSGRGNLEVFLKNLHRWAPGTVSEIIAGNSMKQDFRQVEKLKAGVRFAHIDGGHYREVALNDLYKTEAVLCPGGLIIVDDFLHSGFLGVNEACNYYLREAQGERLSPVASGENKLVLASRSHADGYRAKLGATLKYPRGKTLEFYGEQILCLDGH